MKVWLTTDTHFNHKRMLEFGRPENYENLIYKHLEDIPSGDMVVHLGDFSLGSTEQDKKAVEKYSEILNGRYRILVRGNHDRRSNAWYVNYGFDFVCREFIDKMFGKKILFKHIPDAKYRNIDFQVHGHTHGKNHHDREIKDFYDPKYHVEVALENTGYKPIKLETLFKGRA